MIDTVCFLFVLICHTEKNIKLSALHWWQRCYMCMLQILTNVAGHLGIPDISYSYNMHTYGMRF